MCGLFFLGNLSFVGFCLPFKSMCGFFGVGYKYVRIVFDFQWTCAVEVLAVCISFWWSRYHI